MRLNIVIWQFERADVKNKKKLIILIFIILIIKVQIQNMKRGDFDKNLKHVNVSLDEIM